MVTTEADKIRSVLSTIYDPEIPVVTIEDLGMIKNVYYNKDRKEVELKPTYTGCPATSMIKLLVRQALDAAGYEDIKVKISIDPPWSTDDISEAGKRKLLEYGIAPPSPTIDVRALQTGEVTGVECPSCGSSKIKLVSAYGATPCKAQMQCRSCLEPFEYFKCFSTNE